VPSPQPTGECAGPGEAGGLGDEPFVSPLCITASRSLFWEAPRLAAGWAGVGTVGSAVGSLRILRRVRAVPRAPTCAVAKSDPVLAFLALTCGFGMGAGFYGPDREANRAQAEVVSGAPTTTETPLTSGYLLVEARSPLPEPTRRRPERQ